MRNTSRNTRPRTPENRVTWTFRPVLPEPLPTTSPTALREHEEFVSACRAMYAYLGPLKEQGTRSEVMRRLMVKGWLIEQGVSVRPPRLLPAASEGTAPERAARVPDPEPSPNALPADDPLAGELG